MIQLKLITASTREGRKGPIVSAWILELLKQYQDIEVEHLDLKAINLPFMDEPHHPRLAKYTHEHTKRWSRTIAAADAFIFVTPEYNYGFPATLKNAIDYLFREWQYKPVGLVSYGGIAAGTRCVQLLKPVLSALKMVAVTESVNIPFFTKYINEDERFVSDESLDRAAHAMVAEIIRWHGALGAIRTSSMH
jgi:NAD(P)H-dependent FMN reductase